MNFRVKNMLKTVICILIKNMNTLGGSNFSLLIPADFQDKSLCGLTLSIKVNPPKLLSWKSAGISNEKLEPPEDKNAPKVLFEEVWPYLKTDSFKFLAQKKIYLHKSIVNIYIVYLMPDVTDAKGSDLMRYGLFGATGYDTNNKLVGYGVGFGTQKYTYDDGKKLET